MLKLRVEVDYLGFSVPLDVIFTSEGAQDYGDARNT